MLRKEDIPTGHEHFSLQEYKWLDFGSDGIVFPDNPRASVVIKDLHDPDELRRRVKVPTAFNTPFRAPLKPLYPIDLSEDYRKFMIETQQRRKRRNFDDDDTSTIDFSEISTPPDIEDRLNRWKSRARPEDVTAGARSDAAHHGAGVQQVSRDNSSGAGGDSLRADIANPQNRPLVSSLDTMAGSPVTDAADGQSRRGMLPATDISKDARDKILAKLNATTGADELMGVPHQEGEAESRAHGARGYHDVGGDAGPAAGQVDEDDHQSLDSHSATDVGAEMSSGMHLDQDFQAEMGRVATENYDQGFQAALNKFADLNELLQQTSREFSDLRTQVLREGREIFLEVIKLTAENVLRSQISISDKALFELFDAALENIHQARKIAVQANPHTVARLKEQYSQAGLPFDSIDWVPTDKSPPGDFKIVSKDEVIKVDLENLVSKQISSLTAEIFAPQMQQKAASDSSLESSHKDESSDQIEDVTPVEEVS